MTCLPIGLAYGLAYLAGKLACKVVRQRLAYYLVGLSCGLGILPLRAACSPHNNTSQLSRLIESAYSLAGRSF